MTIKQKQCLLEYLGYFDKENSPTVNNVDTLWGAQSEAATRKFQKDYGLTPDGIFGPATEKRILEVISKGEAPALTWDDIKYFTKEEFRCKCGGKYCNGYPAEMDMEVVRIADLIRARIGKPVVVNSGLRCKQHNANEGGVSDSQHLYGTAVDLGCPNGVTVAKMSEIAEDIMGDTGGLGIYYWGIHVDTRKTKARWNG